jgi:hypothetical protein
VSHLGITLGFRSSILRFPAQHFSVITLCNAASANSGELAYRVADEYLAHVLLPKKARDAIAGTRAVRLAGDVSGSSVRVGGVRRDLFQ